MAIRFVNVKPAATDAEAPGEESAQPPREDAADPQDAEPTGQEAASPEPPRPAARRRKAPPVPAAREAGDAAPDPEIPAAPAGAATALPGFEDSPKPKKRRGAARPYWGFG